MKKLLVVVLLMITPSLARAQSRVVLYPLVMASSAFDAETSRTNIRAGAVESNPIMKPFSQNRASLYAAHVGFSAFAVETSLWAKRHGSRKWWVPMLIHTGVHLGSGWMNRSVR